MSTAPVIHTFNSGRTYTPQGQRIAYAELGRTKESWGYAIEVAFFDVDRQVDGVLTCFMAWADVQFGDAYVLSTYDRGGYHYNPEG